MKILIIFLLFSGGSFANQTGKSAIICEGGDKNCKEVTVYENKQRELTLSDFKINRCFSRTHKGELEYCSVFKVHKKEIRFVCEEKEDSFILKTRIMNFGRDAFDYKMDPVPCTQSPRLGERGYISKCTNGKNKSKYFCETSPEFEKNNRRR